MPYLVRIAQELKSGDGTDRTPLILFGRGNQTHLEALAASGAEGVGVDWTCDLAEARARTGGRVALQGNLDPGALFANPAALREEVSRVLASYGDGPGHVFNLGHGIAQTVNPDNVSVLVDAVHDLSRTRHAVAR